MMPYRRRSATVAETSAAWVPLEVDPSPSQCGCRACGRVFGGAEGFFAHRSGGRCHDPATRRMTKVDGIWRRQREGRPEHWVHP